MPMGAPFEGNAAAGSAAVLAHVKAALHAVRQSETKQMDQRWIIGRNEMMVGV